MFEKLISFTKKVSDLADKPALNSSELKAQFDAAPEEVRVYLNKVIDALTKTTLGDSGAKNIGVTSITGLTGSDIQTVLESLKTLTDTLAKKTQEPWTTATLLNGAYHVSTGDDSGAAFYKNELGEVHGRGTIVSPTASLGTVLWNFPVGYRPGRNEWVTAYYGSSNTYDPILCAITPAGDFKIFENGGVNGGTLRIPNFEFRT